MMWDGNGYWGSGGVEPRGDRDQGLFALDGLQGDPGLERR